MGRKRGNVESVEEALLRAYSAGTIREIDQVEEGVWTVGGKSPNGVELAGFPLGTDAAAVELMERLPGTMIAAPQALTLTQGTRGTVAWIMDRRRLPDVQEARRIWQETAGAPCPWWSVSRIARELLAWAARPERSDPSDERIMPEGFWHHQSCPTPGRYEDLTLYDVSAYYYNLLLNLRSPRVRITAGRVWYTDELRGEEADRWGRMLRAVADHKALRNVLVGCMAGGTGELPCYTSKGGTVPVYAYPMHKMNGPFRAAGLWIVATGMELTHRQALTDNAIYANIDCVVVPSSHELTPVWQSYGLPVGIKAQGEAEICRIGCWRVGRHYTRPYAIGPRSWHAHERMPAPVVRYADQWLLRPTPWRG